MNSGSHVWPYVQCNIDNIFTSFFTSPIVCVDKPTALLSVYLSNCPSLLSTGIFNKQKLKYLFFIYFVSFFMKEDYKKHKQEK